MKTVSKCLIAVLFVAFLAAAHPAGNSEPIAPQESAKLIEVCTKGIAYLPPGTKYVTCRGKIMKVLAIVPLSAGIQTAGDCDCPNCCGGWCGVTVYCQSVPIPSETTNDCGCGKRTATAGGLCTAYLACGD